MKQQNKEVTDCEIFQHLMERLLDLMTAAKKSGGLYEDRIVSKYEGTNYAQNYKTNG